MSRLGKNIGHLETVAVTYPTPVETYNASGVMLPSSEPASGQFSYTVQASDLPTFSDSRVTCKWSLVIIAGGKNNAAATRNIYYRILKNGVSIATSFTVISASYYWTYSFHNLYDVAVGDTFEIRLWCSNDATSLDWRYNTYFVRPTRFVFGDTKDVFLDFACTDYAVLTLAGGFSPGGYAVGEYGSPSLSYYPSDLGTSCTIGSTQKFSAIIHNATYGLGRVNYGDESTTTTAGASNTTMPYYIRCNRHTKFQFRRARP